MEPNKIKLSDLGKNNITKKITKLDMLKYYVNKAELKKVIKIKTVY